MFRLQRVLVLLCLMAPTSVLAQAERYEKCMALVKQQPLAAYEEALAWQSEEGGAPARHCVASAILGLGDLQRGAERLENLGYAPDIKSNDLRVAIFAQAAEAFLQLGDNSRALKAVDAGLNLQPGNTELQLARARALGAEGQTDAALTVLDILLAAKPDNVMALMLRASSLIELKRLDEAGRDIRRARKLDPKNVDVLLVRGQWREAMRLADRQSQ